MNVNFDWPEIYNTLLHVQLIPKSCICNFSRI